MAAAALRRTRVAALTLIDPLYRAFKYSRAARLLDAPVLRWLRYRVVPGMGPRDVIAVLDVLAGHGVPCWLVGGWGVDALVGRETRKHADVDLAVDRRFAERAVAALERDGFRVVQREVKASWMPMMIVLRDGRRRWIELMVVDVPAPPDGEDGRPDAMRFRYADDSITTGTVEGRSVRCLSAEVQMLFRTGYAPRPSDRHDVRVLADRFGLPSPPAYA